MSADFKNIAIIGCGLIGSSICHAIKRYYLQPNNQQLPTARLHIIDHNPEYLRIAQEANLGDEYYANPADGVPQADLIILASPVGSYQAIGKQIAPYIKADCIVSDVGSTKTSVFKDLAPLLPEHCHFIPAHPVAGTENSGPTAGFASLFDNRYVIITPPAQHSPEKLHLLTRFWQNLGAHTEIMSAERHDKILAITSHLPHLIAYTIVGTTEKLGHDLHQQAQTNAQDSIDSRDITRFAAGGFRDFTRIAASDPIMWRDVFLNNQEAVLELLEKFQNDLDYLTNAIKQKDGASLQEWFTKTRAIRRAIIAEKQAGHFIATEEKKD